MKVKFYKLFIDGKIDINAIDDYIDEWHENKDNTEELYEYLGMTKEQYKDWFEGNELYR